MDAGGHRRDALSLRAEQQPARPGNGSHAVHVTRFDVQMAHIGAAISYAWTSRLNVETEIDSSTGINQVKGEELGASVNLLYSLRGADRVRPYVAGGAGVEQYSTSYWCACDDALERGIIIEESSRAAALNAGGGVKIRIGENLSFRADARWLNGLARGRTLYGFWRDMRQHWRVYSGVTFGLGHRTTPSGSWK
jgi:opacity protein-like surface antigen